MTEIPSRLPDSSASGAAAPAASAPPAAPMIARTRTARWPARWLIWPLLLVVVGGGTALLLRRGSAAPAAVYGTDTAAQGTVSILVSGPGTLVPRASVHDPAPTGGVVSGLPAVGTVVKTGQVIGQIKSDSNAQAVQDAQLGLEKARAQLDAQQASQAAGQAGRQSSSISARLGVQDAQDALNSAETTLAGQLRLYAVGAISRSDLNTARAAEQSARNKLASAQAALNSAAQQSFAGLTSDASTLKTLELAAQQAQATLKQARTTLAGQVLRAPASGVITGVDAVNGANVNAGTSLLTIADTSAMQLPVQVDETQISQVKTGMTARATLDALGGQTVQGRVTAISPIAAVQNNISVFTVNVELPNPGGQLRAGMSAQSDIVIAEQSGLIVSSKAVQAVRTRSYVQVVPPGTLQNAGMLAPQTTTAQSSQTQLTPQLNDKGAATAVQTRVQVGLSDGTSTIITGGLQEGDAVLLPQVTARSSRSGTGNSGTGSGTGIPGINIGTGGGTGGGGFRGGN